MLAALAVVGVGALLTLGYRLMNYFLYEILNPILFKLGARRGL